MKIGPTVFFALSTVALCGAAMASDLQLPEVTQISLPGSTVEANGMDGYVPRWYKVERLVSWSDPCDPNRVGLNSSSIMVKFPWDPSVDCFNLDTGTVPNVRDLSDMVPAKSGATELSCRTASQVPPVTVVDCTDPLNPAFSYLVDPITGWDVKYFTMSVPTASKWFILSVTAMGYKGSLGTQDVDGITSERSTSSLDPKTKDAGYDNCYTLNQGVPNPGQVVGKCAPYFALYDQAGANHQTKFGFDILGVGISDFRNPTICPGPNCKKSTMLTLSAEWCGPCNVEASHAEEMSQTYKGRGHQTLELLIEDNAGNAQNPPSNVALPQRWANLYGLTFPVMNDSNYAAWNAYNNAGYLPSHAIWDSSGKLFYRSYGYSYDGVNPCTCPPSVNLSEDCNLRCQIESKVN